MDSFLKKAQARFALYQQLISQQSLRNATNRIHNSAPAAMARNVLLEKNQPQPFQQRTLRMR